MYERSPPIYLSTLFCKRQYFTQFPSQSHQPTTASSFFYVCFPVSSLPPSKKRSWLLCRVALRLPLVHPLALRCRYQQRSRLSHRAHFGRVNWAMMEPSRVSNTCMRDVTRVRTCVRRSLGLRRRGGRKSYGGGDAESARVYLRRVVDKVFGSGNAARA